MCQQKPPISRGCPIPVLTMVSSLLCWLLEYPLLLGAAESAEAHHEGSNILGGSSEDKKPSSTRGFTDAGFQLPPAPDSPIPCPRITHPVPQDLPSPAPGSPIPCPRITHPLPQDHLSLSPGSPISYPKDHPSRVPGSPIPCPRITHLLPRITHPLPQDHPAPAPRTAWEANTSCWSFQCHQALVF